MYEQVSHSLLNRILGGDHGLRVGVLVNDFGAVNIDADTPVQTYPPNRITTATQRAMAAKPSPIP